MFSNYLKKKKEEVIIDLNENLEKNIMDIYFLKRIT
jgi:hypothetical protein